MLAFLRPYLSRRYFIVAGLVALVAAFVLPSTAQYRPLGQQMARRYAEGSNAGKEQTAAQEEQARLVQGFERMAEEFRNIVRVRRPPVITMVQNLNSALSAVARAASRPDFYRNGFIRPEDATSNLACTDPASTADLLNRDRRREKNIVACGVFLATHHDELGEPIPQVTMALLQRVNDAAEADHYPFQTIIAYIWLQYLTQTVNQAEPPGPFPALIDGENYNLALFKDTLPAGFASRLVETATNAEKLDLNSKIYPDLARLAELGTRLARACQIMKRSPCLTAPPQRRT